MYLNNIMVRYINYTMNLKSKFLLIHCNRWNMLRSYDYLLFYSTLSYTMSCVRSRGARGAKSHPNCKIKMYGVWFGLVRSVLKKPFKPNEINTVYISSVGAVYNITFQHQTILNLQ
jgi:hypothetical protein